MLVGRRYRGAIEIIKESMNNLVCHIENDVSEFHHFQSHKKRENYQLETFYNQIDVNMYPSIKDGLMDWFLVDQDYHRIFEKDY